MNTVTLNLAEYDELRDIRTNLEKYKAEADDRAQERKFKVKINESSPYSWTRYETNDALLSDLLLELKEAKEKIQDLESLRNDLINQMNSLKEHKRKKFLGIF